MGDKSHNTIGTLGIFQHPLFRQDNDNCDICCFLSNDNFLAMYFSNLNYNDEINDEINDQITELGLSIIRTVKSNPGIKADKIYEILSANDKGITLNMVRNSIRRELGKYIELRGSRKTGGYYLKERDCQTGE